MASTAAATVTATSTITPQSPLTSSTTNLKSTSPKTQESLPPLSPADFRTYDRLSTTMTYYHTLVRQSWDALYNGTAPTLPDHPKHSSPQPSPAKLIKIGLHFCNHLQTHHDIEEAYWFPVLATKMPGFQSDGFAREQHRVMHRGLDRLRAYLDGCGAGERELRREEVREIMDSFGKGLWEHMDEEVVELGAESMRRYWTVGEMGRLPF